MTQVKVNIKTVRAETSTIELDENGVYDALKQWAEDHYGLDRAKAKIEIFTTSYGDFKGASITETSVVETEE